MPLLQTLFTLAVGFSFGGWYNHHMHARIRAKAAQVAPAPAPAPVEAPVESPSWP